MRFPSCGCSSTQAEAPIAVVRGRHRFRILMKSPRAFELSAYLRDWLAAASRNSGRSHHQRQRERRDTHAFKSNRQEECVQMQGKMARSAQSPPFGLHEVPAAVRTSRLSCRKAGKAQIFTSDRGPSGECREKEESVMLKFSLASTVAALLLSTTVLTQADTEKKWPSGRSPSKIVVPPPTHPAGMPYRPANQVLRPATTPSPPVNPSPGRTTVGPRPNMLPPGPRN